MHDARAFAEAIARTLGVCPDADRIVPGRIVRFSANGKRGDDAGWCKLFEDGRAGVFGNWRTGEQHVWHEAARADSSAVEQQRRRAEIAAAQAARAEEEAQRHARVAETARTIWDGAQPCMGHRYLDRKRIGADGVRVQFAHVAECRSQFFTTADDGERRALRGLLLLIPLRDMDWRVWSLQAIDDRGAKAFLRGGRKRGLFHLVGRDAIHGPAENFDGALGIAEGYATACSVRADTGWPVFVAFDAGNLLAVAQQVRARFPKASIAVCGDNDASGVGQEKAEAAAAAIDGLVAVPPLSDEDRARGLTDWNDYLLAYGKRKAAA